MKISMRPAGLCLITMTALSACGGGGGSSEMVDPSPDIPVLSDASVTTLVDVTVLSRSGSEDGTFDPSTGTTTAGTDVSTALTGGINSGLDYLRVTDTGSIAISETVETIGLGSATYTGSALLRVTDIATTTVYDGEADATITVSFDAAGGSTLTYENFDGTAQVGLSPATSFDDGTVTISDMTISSEGAFSGGTGTLDGFGDTDITGAVTAVDGRFGGPSAEELGGTAAITATNGTVTSTFAASR